jgi:hypothetical protein
MYRNRRTLYRSLSGATLILFAAFAFAPELGFTPQLPLLAKDDGTATKAKNTAHEPAPQSQPLPNTPTPRAHEDTQPSEPANTQPDDEEESAFAVNAQPTHPAIDANRGATETNSPAPIQVAFAPHFSGGSTPPKNTASIANSKPRPVIGTANSAAIPTGDQSAPQHDDRIADNDNGYAADPEPPRVVTLPEPSSLLLLAVGIIGLIIVRRRVA